MRSDMSKILVERPRIGNKNGEEASRHARRAQKQELRFTGGDDESNVGFGNTASMTSHLTDNHKRSNSAKELNENLKPLQRFLRSRLGQPWDKVYSEIMANLNLNNAAQYHVWQHLILFGEVETKTYMEGNTVMIAGKTPRSVGEYSWRQEFYVHPKTGLLCGGERARDQFRLKHNKEADSLNEVRYIDPKKPLVQYHKIAGVWYKFQMRAATDQEKAKKQFGGFRPDWDDKAGKRVLKWNNLYDNKFVAQLESRYKTNYYYRHDSLWERCKGLFGGPYLPLNKQQIGSREVKKIEALIAIRKCKKAA